MRRTGFLYDERFLLHKTGPGHPEAPERLTAIYSELQRTGLLTRLIPIPAIPAKIKWIEKVHSPRHIYRFEEACLLDLGELDHPDNQISPESFDTAILAVGGILNTVDHLMRGEIDNAFCAVRPPGHHAEPNKALGFCYFNNISIAAKYLQLEWQVGRIAIVDFDAHHGNGTQRIFEEDPNVLYLSIHEHPSFAYPGTGREFETGSGAGAGYTLNTTILPGGGDDQYQLKIKRDFLPALDKFRPEILLVSAGFDAHVEDDMSDLKLTTPCFSWITEQVVEIAGRYSQGRLISILEGGYALNVLPEVVSNHIRILLGV